jgi:hypothetical protein
VNANTPRSDKVCEASVSDQMVCNAESTMCACLSRSIKLPTRTRLCITGSDPGSGTVSVRHPQGQTYAEPGHLAASAPHQVEYRGCRLQHTRIACDGDGVHRSTKLIWCAYRHMQRQHGNMSRHNASAEENMQRALGPPAVRNVSGGAGPLPVLPSHTR